MDIKEAYKVMQENCGIKKGDTVKVLRKAEAHEMGWANIWTGSMDRFIGKECTVRGVSDEDIDVQDENDWFNFPFFVLEKIKPSLPNPISLNGEYDVIFKKGGAIEVGCQTIDFETIEEIYKTAKSTLK